MVLEGTAELTSYSTTLWQSIVDNGVLEAVRQWLEPIYPSGALPAVGIQKAIFEVLPKVLAFSPKTVTN